MVRKFELFLLSMLGCSIAVAAWGPAPVSNIHYLSPGRTYSLDLPGDWTVEPLPTVAGFVQNEPRMIARAPGSAASLSIEVEGTDGTIRLDSYYARWLAAEPRFVRKFRVAAEIDFQAGQLQGKEVIYSFETADDRHRAMQLVRFFLVDGGRACVLTGGISSEHGHRNLSLFEQIAKSFKFIASTFRK